MEFKPASGATTTSRYIEEPLDHVGEERGAALRGCLPAIWVDVSVASDWCEYAVVTTKVGRTRYPKVAHTQRFKAKANSEGDWES